MVRVGGYQDRAGIQQALDCGADGILIPYINTAAEAKEGISCCKYPTTGTRSVYFPQRATNKKGLLGYVGNANDNVIVALQVRRITHPCHRLPPPRQSTLAASGPAVDPTPAPSPAGPPAQACPHGRLPAPGSHPPLVAIGGDGRLHHQHGGDRCAARDRHPLPRAERPVHVYGPFRARVRVPGDVLLQGAERGDRQAGAAKQ